MIRVLHRGQFVCFIVLLFSIQVCGLGLALEGPDASAILRNLSEAYKNRPPAAMDVTMRPVVTNKMPPNFPFRAYEKGRFFQDGDRIDISSEQHRFSIENEERKITKVSSFFDGTQQVSWTEFLDMPGNHSGGILEFRTSAKPPRPIATSSQESGSWIDGIVEVPATGKVKHIVDALIEQNAQNNARLIQTDTGSQLVVTAETDYGDFEVRFSATPPYDMQGYRAQCKDTHAQYADKLPPYDLIETEVEITKTEEVNGIRVPVEGRLVQSARRATGEMEPQQIFTLERSNIQWNPDFEALKAFQIRAPEGTRFRDTRFEGVQYIWDGEKLVPQNDNKVMDAVASIGRDIEASGGIAKSNGGALAAYTELPASQDLAQVNSVPRWAIALLGILVAGMLFAILKKRKTAS